MRKTNKVIALGNCLYPEYTKGTFAGMCYAVNGIAPALLTMGGEVTGNLSF